MSLTELTNELAKSFDACLESILADPQQKEEDADGLDAQLVALKSSFIHIENQLRDIRLKALGSKELSVLETNKLLKRDIEIKKSTIDKYVTKLDVWKKELPLLKENSEKAVSLRTDGHDFDSNIVLSNSESTLDVPAKDEDEDEDEDAEFEEV